MDNQSFTAHSPYVLNNATEIRRSRFDPKKFTDQNFLYHTYTKDSFTTYKGMLALWNQRNIINTPLINMTELQRNVMLVNNTEGRFRYSIPYDIGMPEVVENVETDNAKPGLDGQPFKIKLNSDIFSNTDILTVDETDGIQIAVTSAEIKQANGGWIYTVELVNSSRRGAFYPHAYMKPGTKYMKIQNFNDEYDTQMSAITTTSGMMELEMELGSGKRSVTHWITGAADMMRLDESKNPSLAFINSRLNNTGAVTLYYNKDANGNPIPGSMTWHSTIELLCRAEMEKMTEKGLMFAQGGYASGTGRRKARIASGLYPQMRNGNRITYNTITLELIESQVQNLFLNTGIPVEQRRTVIQTGDGGLNQIAAALRARMQAQTPYMIQAKDMPGGGLLYGDTMNAGFKEVRFTQYFSPVAGYIEFKVNEALNTVNGQTFDGLVGQYPTKSYDYMIMDVTNKSSTNATAKINTEYRVEDGFNSEANIVMVKPQGFSDTLYWGYIDGTHSHLGAPGMRGMNSANAYPGYQIWMHSYGTVWMKDVTRSLLIEKARPGIVYNVDLP